MTPFRKLDGSVATREDVLAQFSKCGFAWIGRRADDNQQPAASSRPSAASSAATADDPTNTASSSDAMDALRTSYQRHANDYAAKWTVENRGNRRVDEELSAASILGTNDNDEPSSSGCVIRDDDADKFYVSTILSSRSSALDDVLKLLPFDGEGTPPWLGPSRHDGGCWLFVGSNRPRTSPSSSSSSSSSSTPNQKRTRDGARLDDESIRGRAEHVDQVEHSGTWHVQLKGNKTWLVRPNADAIDDWGSEAGGPPDITESQHAEQSEKRAWRLRIQVEEGDTFVLNTRAWWHRTELEVSPDMSISVARDFYLPAEPLYADADYSSGEVVLDEADIPDELPRSSEPNCALAEVEGQEEDVDDEDDNASIVLVAICDITKGEALTIAEEEEEGEGSDKSLNSEDDGEEECNAPDAVDPRSICKSNFKKGDILLRNDAIPEELFCSPDDPSCEIIEDGNDDVVLRALRDITEGEILSIARADGVEYDEVDVDLATGELVK